MVKTQSFLLLDIFPKNVCPIIINKIMIEENNTNAHWEEVKVKADVESTLQRVV